MNSIVRLLALAHVHPRVRLLGMVLVPVFALSIAPWVSGVAMAQGLLEEEVFATDPRVIEPLRKALDELRVGGIVDRIYDRYLHRSVSTFRGGME